MLTKSEFTAGLQCPKRLFLEKLRKDIPRETAGLAEKWRRGEGQKAGELARERFAGGVLVDSAPWESDEAVARTAALMSQSTPYIFEAALASDEFAARVDVLAHCDRGWALTEVKTGMEPKEGEEAKDKYVADAAFQLMVAREAGVPVERVSLLLLSRAYRYPGGRHDSRSFFQEVDVTAAAEGLIPTIRGQAREFLELLDGQEPVVDTNRQCKKPHKCPYYDHCHRDQPEHDLIFLPTIKAEKITELRSKGYRTIDQIPDEEKLNAGQARVRDSIRSGLPWIGEGLAGALQAFAYPIHFIDFEAAPSAFPRYVGRRCHDPVPFQWSDHILHEDGRLEHREFLADGNVDPCVAFTQTLWDAVQGAGSVVSYTEYENQRLKGLRLDGVRFSQELEAYVRSKGVDLFKVVKEHFYHPGFRGSYSIKTVLPALVPALGYEDLAIRDGEAAAVEFLRLVDGLDAEEVAGIRAALLAYCERDTLAMVEVFKALRALCAPVEQAVFELI